MKRESTMLRWALHAGLVVALLLAPDLQAQDGAKAPAGDAKVVKASETRGVEISATSSVVQKGVKRGSQLNLEKALDLIARPRPGGGGGSKSAAGIGGGGGRPAGGGGGDGKARTRMKGNIRQKMDSGS